MKGLWKSLARVGTLLFGLVLGAAILLAQTEAIAYFHNDLSGTPLLATDAAGNVVWKENYRPYGERLNNLGVVSNLKIVPKTPVDRSHPGQVHCGDSQG